MKDWAGQQRWTRLLAGALGLLIVFAAGLAVDIYAYSFTSDPSPAEAAVVLGAAAANGQPSPVFAERIRHAVALYQTGQVRFLIFAGGQGVNEPLPEASVAAQAARRQGVAAQNFFCEVTSRITLENLQGAAPNITLQPPMMCRLSAKVLDMRRANAVMTRGSETAPQPRWPRPAARWLVMVLVALTTACGTPVSPTLVPATPTPTPAPARPITRERAIAVAIQACALPDMALVSEAQNVRAQLTTLDQAAESATGYDRPLSTTVWLVQMDGQLQLIGGVENKVHWVLDVGFREDDCRIRQGHAAQNFATIRHIALNLLRHEKTAKGGIHA